MSTEELNQAMTVKVEDNGVPLPRSVVVKLETETNQRKRKLETAEETSVKMEMELEWKPENCAQAIGKMIKSSGDGRNKKWHYEKFEFHGKTYGLENTVLLIPEYANQKPYVAVIKDIFIQGKDGYVKLDVQWFYRPEDVDKYYVRNWRSKDARDLFYSFHRDVVFAESVMHRCNVYFVPENKQIPDRRDYPGFIVQRVYNTAQKKLWKFTHTDFDVQQIQEIGLLQIKTNWLIGELPDIERKKKTLNSESSNVVNAPDYKSILEKFDMLTGDLDRDKNLEELLEAVKDKCRLTKEKHASDYDYFWPNDAAAVVRVLEQALYDSLAKDIPKYNHKLKVIVYQLKNGHTIDEIMAMIKEPISKRDEPSTSRNVRRRVFLDD